MHVNEKIIGEGFPLLVTLKSLLLFPYTFQANLSFTTSNIAKRTGAKLVFCVFPEKNTALHFFLGGYIALVKKFHKPLLQKIETKIFKEKRFHKNLVQSKREKNSSILRLNKIMCELLTTSKCLQLNCLQIQELLAIVTLF